MNKPTGEEVREFWEICGLSKRGGYWWYDSNGKHLTADNPPPIDLKNLFRWALPKLLEVLDAETQFDPLLVKWITGLEWDEDEDPALSLFWVVYEVLKSK